MKKPAYEKAIIDLDGKVIGVMPVFFASPRLNKILMEEKGNPPFNTSDGKTTDEFLNELLK